MSNSERPHRRAPRGQRSICTVAGCGRPVVGHGYCDMHYQRWRKWGDASTVRLKRSRRAWTPNELAEIEDLVSSGWSDARIAKRFQASVNGIQLARKRHGIPSRTESILSARTIAARMGISCSKGVVRWLREGWLKGKRGQRRGRNRQWFVTEEGWLAFLADPDHWHRWDPARLTDPNVREWIEDLRAGVCFLTLPEVAERFYVEPRTVAQWIDKGLLPAVRNGNRLIRECDLEGWVPPSQIPRTKLALMERQLDLEWHDLPAPLPFRRVRILRKVA